MSFEPIPPFISTFIISDWTEIRNGDLKKKKKIDDDESEFNWGTVGHELEEVVEEIIFSVNRTSYGCITESWATSGRIVTGSHTHWRIGRLVVDIVTHNAQWIVFVTQRRRRMRRRRRRRRRRRAKWHTKRRRASEIYFIRTGIDGRCRGGPIVNLVGRLRQLPTSDRCGHDT